MLNHNTVAYFIPLSLLFLLHSKQVIKSFSYKVFYAFIKYLYTDEVNMKPEDAIGKLLSAVKAGSVFWGRICTSVSESGARLNTLN